MINSSPSIPGGGVTRPGWAIADDTVANSRVQRNENRQPHAHLNREGPDTQDAKDALLAIYIFLS